MAHTNHLRSHRKRWALSQRQLAHLAGLRARSVISSYELGRSEPAVRRALAYQFIFGVRLQALFPGLAQEIQEEVLRRAAQLDERCRHRGDATSVRINELLTAMISRVDSDDGA